MADRNWRQGPASEETRTKILDMIERFTEEHGYPPTKHEIADDLGIAYNTARRHIAVLIADGRLEEGDGPRTLRIAF